MKPIPSIVDLYNKLEADLKSRLNLSNDDLKFVLNAMAGVLAAQLKIAYLFLGDIQNNIFPDTADTAADGGTLDRLSLIYLNRNRFPARPGTYVATVTGTTGAIIPANVTAQSNGNSFSPGNLYQLNNAYTMPGTTGTITIISLDSGTPYLLNVGDQLTFTQPIIGINPTLTISSITIAPEDEEDINIWRSAILNAIRLQPQGGAKTDYRIWAADAQGVRLVYPYVKNGAAGTVQVYVEAQISDSIDGLGTPSSLLLTDVANVIETNPDVTLPTNERGRRPIQAYLEVLPILPQPVDVIITGMTINTAQIRADISTNLTAYLYAIRPYIAGADLPRDKNDILTAVKMQSVVNDTLGTGNSFLAFTMYVQGVQVNSFTFSLANIPYLRNVVYN